MKLTIFSALFFFCSIFFVQNAYACNSFFCEPELVKKDSAQQYADFDDKKQIVYICSGSTAYAYHSVNNCAGLNNCQAQVYSVDANAAVNTHKRVPCCRCWSNVTRCHDDNPNAQKGNTGGSGGGYNSGAGAVALVVVVAAAVASVFLISNEIYAGGTVSFYKPKSPQRNYSRITPGVGGVFQLRKNFKNSGLEYGLSVFKYNGGYGRGYSNEFYQFGGHVSYVHNFFDKKMPDDKMRVFAGPTIKYVNTLGIGAIVGVSYELLDWLRADFRYELTNQSNQFQLGLNFLYKKESVWLKPKNL